MISKGSIVGEQAANMLRCRQMDEGRKRVLGIIGGDSRQSAYANR